MLGHLPSLKQMAAALLLAAAYLAPSAAKAADKSRATGFTDIYFGEIGISGSDITASRDLCIYTNSSSQQYSLLAAGSQSSSDFAITSTASAIPIDVQWSDQAGQSSGRTIQPNVTESGFSTNARNQTCNSGPAATASLILTLRGAELAIARAGSYSGWLSITIAPL